MNFRKLHRKVAPIIFLPLLLSALSGMAYRIGKSWFGLSDDFGDLMMVIHEGRYLGKPLVPVYVLLTGLGLAVMLISGITMIKNRKESSHTESKLKKFNFRLFHGFLAPIFFLPLLVTVLTGITYRLGKAWFGLSDQQAKFFLDIHQGNYLGKDLRVLYILFLGLGLLSIIATGIQMTGIVRGRSAKA